jgi:hypothetical protein
MCRIRIAANQDFFFAFATVRPQRQLRGSALAVVVRRHRDIIQIKRLVAGGYFAVATWQQFRVANAIETFDIGPWRQNRNRDLARSLRLSVTTRIEWVRRLFIENS